MPSSRGRFYPAGGARKPVVLRSRTKFQRAACFVHPADINASANTANHPTITMAAIAPAVILAFSLNV
jgi:hypothetical protein